MPNKSLISETFNIKSSVILVTDLFTETDILKPKTKQPQTNKKKKPK